jgi:hypothetical protein
MAFKVALSNLLTLVSSENAIGQMSLHVTQVMINRHHKSRLTFGATRTTA